jgi:hypothetical protein
VLACEPDFGDVLVAFAGLAWLAVVVVRARARARFSVAVVEAFVDGYSGVRGVAVAVVVLLSLVLLGLLGFARSERGLLWWMVAVSVWTLRYVFWFFVLLVAEPIQMYPLHILIEMVVSRILRRSLRNEILPKFCPALVNGDGMANDIRGHGGRVWKARAFHPRCFELRCGVGFTQYWYHWEIGTFDWPVNAVEEPDETDGIHRSRESLAKLLHIPERLLLFFFLFLRRFCAHLPAREGLPGKSEHFFVAGAEQSDVVELWGSALVREPLNGMTVDFLYGTDHLC